MARARFTRGSLRPLVAAAVFAALSAAPAHAAPPACGGFSSGSPVTCSFTVVTSGQVKYEMGVVGPGTVVAKVEVFQGAVLKFTATVSGDTYAVLAGSGGPVLTAGDYTCKLTITGSAGQHACFAG